MYTIKTLVLCTPIDIHFNAFLNEMNYSILLSSYKDYVVDDISSALQHIFRIYSQQTIFQFHILFYVFREHLQLYGLLIYETHVMIYGV